MKFIINITGGAYLKLQKPDGEYVYTLGRQFTLNELGVIITEQRYKLINETTVPLPPIEAFKISKTGDVFYLWGGIWNLIGVIKVIGFEHPELLEDLGDGYYKDTTGSGQPDEGTAGNPPFEDTVIDFIPEAGRKYRRIVSLNINNLGKINDFIAKMRGISLSMSQHIDIFPSFVPSLADFDHSIDELEEAEAATKTRRRGSTAERDVKYSRVMSNVRILQNYVQVLSDNADDDLSAIDLIIKAGFEIKVIGIRIKEKLKAENGEVSGRVKLTAKSGGKRSANEWQMRTDTGEWINLPATLQSTTYVNGLTAGKDVYFRCRTVRKEGVSDWSAEVVIMVT